MRHAAAHGLAEKFEEFVRRVRRAGLLFIATVTGLLVLSLAAHPIGLLLWLLALPLAAFGALLSMLWPTRRFVKRRRVSPAAVDQFGLTRAWLIRTRSEIPLVSRPAFDLVLDRVTRIESLIGAARSLLVTEEAQRLVGQHLPRLIQSFLSLPQSGQSDVRIDALNDGLIAIAEELAELSDRILSSMTDRFEIERQFIASRYPRRNGLGAV